MNMRQSVSAGLGTVFAASTLVQQVAACGGFFCQLVPINQAAEQIIFHQDGDQVTAVVLIQYVGTAQDFSWVVPVPGIPELSTGSDVLFQALEPSTRPLFTLEFEGQACTFEEGDTDQDALGPLPVDNSGIPGTGTTH